MQSTAIVHCQSLSDVRTQIDRIDSKLLTLLLERSAYVQQAAAFKKNPAEVAAPERVAQILAAIENRAQALGLVPGLARAVWQTMIERFIAFEQSTHAAQKPPPAQES